MSPETETNTASIQQLGGNSKKAPRRENKSREKKRPQVTWKGGVSEGTHAAPGQPSLSTGIMNTRIMGIPALTVQFSNMVTKAIKDQAATKRF